MTASQTLAQLERQCRELGVRLIYDELRGEGGLCRLRDGYIVVINRRAAVETRVKLLSEALLAVEQRPIVAESDRAEVDSHVLRPTQFLSTKDTKADIGSVAEKTEVAEPVVEEFAHHR